MLLLEPKAAQNTLKPIIADVKTASQDKEFSFVDLLKGFELSNTIDLKAKDQQNTKEESLSSIQKEMQKLLGDESSSEDLSLLDPKLSEKLDKSELYQLISKAKSYLKEQIEQTPQYKKAQIQELPTTLKSLVEVAKKFGIDVTKISVEIEQKTNTKEAKPQTELLKSVEQESVTKPKESVTPKVLNLQSTQTNIAKTVVNLEEQKQTFEFKQESIQAIQEKVKTKEEKTLEQKVQTFSLFKEEILKPATTEQFVQLRQPKGEDLKKQGKEKIEETLALLLRGKNTESSQTNLTSDFAVATAKVIAPELKQTAQTTLESLLRSDTKSSVESLGLEDKSISKAEVGAAGKNENLELKISEAKQMIKYLSSDVKTAIDEYRSPFSRIKLQLNPQRLGELDLTIVQRGNNLHVNMSANNAAINTLALHANELRTQLTNSGINNASLHFSNNSEGGSGSDASGQQQQQQQQNSQAHKEYSYIANEEMNEELTNSLEIVVPRYI